MIFKTYVPCPILRPYVKSFAIQEVANETTYTILPDTSIVIGFQYRGKLSRIDNQTEIPLSVSGVSGLSDRSRIFKNSSHIGTILVSFKEAGAIPFFNHPLHELFRESVSLDNFMLRSELLILEDQLAAATTDISRISIVESFLIKRIMKAETDTLILAAVALIHKSRGNIRIKKLTEQLHISQSPLEKRFRRAVGTSPKKFASIVRLKHVLRHYTPQSSLTELGYEAGFYDQAHFIREFKSFTGLTPENFFTVKK